MSALADPALQPGTIVSVSVRDYDFFIGVVVNEDNIPPGRTLNIYFANSEPFCTILILKWVSESPPHPTELFARERHCFPAYMKVSPGQVKAIDLSDELDRYRRHSRAENSVIKTLFDFTVKQKQVLAMVGLTLHQVYTAESPLDQWLHSLCVSTSINSTEVLFELNCLLPS